MRKLATLLPVLLLGCGPKPALQGSVVDRNGTAMSRAIVSLSPGNAELVTDRDGNWKVDYLRDAGGERARLQKRTEYVLEVFKPGYHTFVTRLPYKKGVLVVDTVTMVEESIDLADLPENLDPSLYKTQTQSSGANYEGQ
jgi:hypothetical protein